MDPVMEPITGPILIPGSISGTAIIDDLLSRIEEQLSRDCNLRQVDVYSGYAAKVQIELQLLDIYPAELVATVKVGEINSQLPSAHIDLSGEVEAEPESGNLERPIDESGVTEPATAAAAKRWYAPRNGKPLPLGSRRTR
jgi:hypothetical protein